MSLKTKLSALLLFISTLTIAQTNFTGVISSNTTWSLTNSPYIVTGNVLVNSGVTLTIEAGVIIKVNTGFGIQSNGEIIAIGTAASKIIFTSNSSSPLKGDWSGISLLNQSVDPSFDSSGNYISGTIFKYVDIKYTGNQAWTAGIKVNSADLYLDHCNISNGDQYGVFFSSSNNNLWMRDCSILDHTFSGVYVLNQNGTVEINNSSIENNAEHGISIQAKNYIISNNLFRNNSTGFVGAALTIYSGSSSGNYKKVIRKNKFIDHGRLTIHAELSGLTQISQNIFINTERAVVTNQTDIRLDSNVFVDNSIILRNEEGIDLSMKYNHILNNNKSNSSWGSPGEGLIIHAFRGLNKIDFGFNTMLNNHFSSDRLLMVKYRNTSSVKINNNNLLSGNSQYFIYNNLNSSQPNIDAKNNYWATQSTNQIGSKIYDWNDNLNKSIVNYSPILTKPDTMAPISPPSSVIKKSVSGSVNLSWAGNLEEDVAGYKIYWTNPTGYSYSMMIDVGNVTSYTLNGVSNLSAEYAVVAYDNMANGDDLDVFEGHQSWFAVSKRFSNSATTSNFSGTNIPCNGDSVGHITLNTSFGTAPFSYSWAHDPSLSINQASNLKAGTYFYSIADSDGLVLTDSIVLIEPDSLFFTVSKTDILCAGTNDGTISFFPSGGSGPFQYSINGGSSFSASSSFTSLGMGVYPLEILDANNCSVIDTVILQQLGFLSLSLDSSSNLSCYNANDGYISVSASGGNLPYSYSWSNGDTIEDISNLAANNYSLTVTDANGCSQTLNHNLTEPSNLNVTASVSAFNGFEISCNGAADGAITLFPNGGTSPYSFSWGHDNSLSSNSISGLAPGTYVYTVVDDLFCQFVDSIFITEPSTLNYTVSQNNIPCHGGSTGTINFSLSGGVTPYQYSIDNGLNFFPNPNFSSLNSGSYFTHTKDANNCLILDTIILTEPTSIFLSLDSASNVNCNGGNDGFIAMTASGGVSPYSYNWNNGAFITDDIYNLSANSYALLVTDANNCTANFTYTITEPSQLTTTVSVSSFNGYQISCNGAADGFINLNPIGGTMPYTFSWAHDNTLITSTISNLDTGSYIYTITDNNFCSISDTISITQADSLQIQAINLYPNNCSNGADGSLSFNVIGGALPYSFSIFDSIGNVISNSDSIGNLIHGTYSFSVSDVNGCSISSSNIYLNYLHNPINPVISAMDSVICSGTNTMLSLNQGIQSVVWNDGQTGLNRSLPSGRYWVTSIDSNGCLGISDTIEIHDLVVQDTSAQICLVTYDPVLDKNKIIFDKPDDEFGISTYNIYKDVFGVWQNIGTVNNGDSSQFVDNTSQPSSKVARYFIETEDQCGVKYSTPASSIHKTVLLQSSIGSNNEVNLAWNQYEGASIWYYRILRGTSGIGFTSIDSVGSSFNTYIDNNPLTGNTSYFIEAVLNSGCTVKAKNNVYSSLNSNAVTENTIGLLEILLTDFNIYPNPTNDLLNIENLSNGKERKEICLFDINGKLIYRISSDKVNIQLDLSDFPKGIYNLKVITSKGILTQKVIKH